MEKWIHSRYILETAGFTDRLDNSRIKVIFTEMVEHGSRLGAEGMGQISSVPVWAHLSLLWLVDIYTEIPNRLLIISQDLRDTSRLDYVSGSYIHMQSHETG